MSGDFNGWVGVQRDGCEKVVAEIIRFLEGQKIALTGHPRYSPALAPNDFYVFSSTKNYALNFSIREEAVDAFKMNVWRYLNQN
ncbi:hypothetical protein EVAR_48091_1 [Eumeta japonica]|uniref:Histone-lysine N-methyltransferase SETMAR n=1 Tax=Eumeta variegata TaxID=151549 RepID=A0A4C1XL12_EUMVA|nr:hypothetical protein EVAR_48091_1 [Eumeta japonica]